MSAPLRLFGELGSPAHPGPAIARKGFRTFFLLAAAFAVAILPIWMLALLGAVDPSGYFDAMSWHAHEMLFGFAVAVIAGFLLTAVANWTQRETLVGTPLLVLAALWFTGRASLVLGHVLPLWAPAACDLAFLPALAFAIGRPLVLSKNRKNFVMLALIAALWLANLTMHLDVLGVLPGMRRQGSLVAVDLVVLMIVVMAGRVFPMFTRNGTGIQAIRSLPALDAAAVASMALLTVADVVAPDRAFTPWVAAATGILALARSATWGTRHTIRTPLLWVLHVGYLWIPIGLFLRAVAAFTPSVPAAVATHALTIGGIGTITLGMMARVSLGHSGRPLTTSPTVVASFVLITLAAIARVLTPILSVLEYRTGVYAAGILWSAAFALYLVAYAPVLMAPRIDGKAG